MAICRLIYSSRITDDTDGLVPDILAAASRNNADLGLTGALMLDHQSVLQLLEGRRAAVSKMFRRISADPRHNDIQLIHVSDVPRRIFPSWSMHYASLRGSGPVSLKAFMSGVEFAVGDLASDSANALFADLSQRAVAEPSLE